VSTWVFAAACGYRRDLAPELTFEYDSRYGFCVDFGSTKRPGRQWPSAARNHRRRRLFRANCRYAASTARRLVRLQRFQREIRDRVMPMIAGLRFIGVTAVAISIHAAASPIARPGIGGLLAASDTVVIGRVVSVVAVPMVPGVIRPRRIPDHVITIRVDSALKRPSTLLPGNIRVQDHGDFGPGKNAFAIFFIACQVKAMFRLGLTFGRYQRSRFLLGAAFPQPIRFAP
jgi:hypothetical protein